MIKKKEFKLIQQTPIIHFQHYQIGATLRASEVKPKLDKYLRRVCRDKIKKNWYIPNSKALNYKMRIVAKDKATKTENLPMCFGNKKVGVHYNECELHIICYNDGLANIIDKNIERFFLLHNFGTRQSKGYGGFVCKKVDSKIDDSKIDDREKRASIGDYIEAIGDVKGFYFKTGDEIYEKVQNVYNEMKGYLCPKRKIRRFPSPVTIKILNVEKPEKATYAVFLFNGDFSKIGSKVVDIIRRFVDPNKGIRSLTKITKNVGGGA